MSRRVFVSCRLTGGSRIRVLAAVTALAFSNASCNRSKNEPVAAETNTPASVEVKAPVPSPEKKKEVVPPLPAAALEQAGKMGVLVLIPGSSGKQGILFDGAPSDSSGRNYLVICEAPADLKSVGIVYQGGTGIGKSFAKRISTLPSGLSLFGFTSNSYLTSSRLKDPVTGETFHAIRLKGEGPVPAEETTAMMAELNTIRNQISENQRKGMENRMQMQGRPVQGEDPRERFQARNRERAALGAETKALEERHSELAALLKIPIKSLATVEVAAGTGPDTLEAAGSELEDSLLVTSSSTLRGIRSGGKWLDLKEIIATSGDQINSVKIDLSGSQQSANVSCQLALTLPSAEDAYSMVAVTTFELESQGSGSLEERLAAVSPVSFQGRGNSFSASRQLAWNGRKTKLWLKVFNDKNPGKLILDEVVDMDYREGFSARWGKPPSPLITLPAALPDTPEDLVREQQSIDAKGQIRDIIAAGDGSVVIVQTNQPPFWAPLDLKTGQWMNVPWKATADTLVATQAGKIYLVDRRTRVLEVWGLASGKREGMQLLPLQGPITALAAPLSDPAQPLMVATETNGYFLDPVKFEVVPSGLDIDGYFNVEAGRRRGQSPLDPATLCIRASDDGALYSFSGMPGGSGRTTRFNLILTVDRPAMVVATAGHNQLLASRGRNLTRGFPDHGGSGVSVSHSPSGGRFPGPSGEIRFSDSTQRDGLAVMKDPPVLPDRYESSKGYLAADRGVYLDSTAGLILLPDGDKLHLVRLKLPVSEKMLPEFLFPGETLELPLPAGTGHKLTCREGGKSEIGPTSIRWFPPVSDRGERVSLNLEWTGELGSQINKDYQIQLIKPTRGIEVISPDGLKKVALHPRCILSEIDSNNVGFAGSGTVVLVNESGTLSAWSLATSELLFRVKGRFSRVLGDADRIYALGDGGDLTCYDIGTGEVVGKVDLGKNIESLATGMSSRNPLLAVEQEGVDAFLLQIPRDTLKPLIMDLSPETRRRLFIPQMVSNASGSAVWSREAAIFRDSRAITVKTFSYEVLNGMSDGTPDASGQLIVGRNTILNLASEPPKSVKISSLPGAGESTTCKLDQSGRYLMLSGPAEESLMQTLSLREVREPSKELLKIRFPSLGGGQMPWIISGTNTLVQFLTIGDRQKAAVFDFDVSELTKQLAR